MAAATKWASWFSTALAPPKCCPTALAQEAAFGYLGVQVVLSYFISGQVKIVNPEWRSGRALQDVFRFSAYPVSEALRELANHPRLLWSMSWGVMVFEVLFPFSLLSPMALITALALAASFHLSNACFFGLNRFVWFWISAYPSILWLQTRPLAGRLIQRRLIQRRLIRRRLIRRAGQFHRHTNHTLRRERAGGALES